MENGNVHGTMKGNDTHLFQSHFQKRSFQNYKIIKIKVQVFINSCINH
jgi:hypothetical protein